MKKNISFSYRNRTDDQTLSLYGHTATIQRAGIKLINFKKNSTTFTPYNIGEYGIKEKVMLKIKKSQVKISGREAICLFLEDVLLEKHIKPVPK